MHRRSSRGTFASLPSVLHSGKALIVVVVLAITGLLGVELLRRRRAVHQHNHHAAKRFKVPKARGQHRGAKPNPGASTWPIHVCLATDDTDLRGLVVAIKTTVAYASDPSRLSFHVITTPELVTLFDTVLPPHLQGVKVEVRHSKLHQDRLSTLVQFVKHTATSVREERLHTAFNFVPFFLPDFYGPQHGFQDLTAERVIYMDTDVLVFGDLAELRDMPMSKAVAAPIDCSQRFVDAFGPGLVNKLGLQPRSCLTQRGLFVADLPRWITEDVSGRIEMIMRRERERTEVLWVSPFPPTPWLLALDGNVQALESEWGCSGLGRETMTYDEGKLVRRFVGFDNRAISDLRVQVDMQRGNMTPWLAPCSRTAKALHFNGPLKPWLSDAFDPTTVVMPVCALPEISAFRPEKPSWTGVASIDCETQRFVRCHDLWYGQISKEADCALKDVNGEWAEDDRSWHNRLRIAIKKKSEDALIKSSNKDKNDKKKGGKKKVEQEAKNDQENEMEKAVSEQDVQMKEEAEQQEKDSMQQ